MSGDILVISRTSDPTTQVILEALRIKGATVDFLDLQLVPVTDNQTLAIHGDEFRLFSKNGPTITSESRYRTIWSHRSSANDLLPGAVDPRDRDSIFKSLNAHNSNIYTLIENICASSDCLQINSRQGKRTAEAKAFQLQVAARLGFTVPDTIISNNYDDIKEFASRYDRVICKSLVPMCWEEESGSLFGGYTARLTDIGLIGRGAFEVHPAIYQPEIEKEYEIRVTIFGGHAFSLRIDLCNRKRGSHDWRAGMLSSKSSQPYELPPRIEGMLHEFMAVCGIKFGAFDLIRDRQGRYVFLEVNEAGKFLFPEEAHPSIRLTDAFSHYLMHHSLEGWSQDDGIRIHSIYESVANG